jgi:hypothetical protein
MPATGGQGYLDHGMSAQIENKWVFEVAWEVVNKGIAYPCRVIFAYLCA